MIEQQQMNNASTVMTSGEKQKKPSQLWGIFLLTVFLLTMYLGAQLVAETLPPAGSPHDVTLRIPEGGTVSTVGSILLEHGVIRNKTLFTFVVQVRGLDTKMPSGEFLFHVPKNLFAVIGQLARHERGISQVRVTIPEGLTIKQMTAVFSATLPRFQSDEFFELAKDNEGYLFPDTYFFYSTATSGTVFLTLQNNFIVKTKALYDECGAMNKNWSNEIIMASIIEEEAVTDVDRKLVSGILWNRIKRGMRLQVDASFAYIMNKASSEVTVDDLNNDSPYNTYRHDGLPPKPISNPGLASIDAALHPTQSEYLYYLSDEDGGMHYAKTFEEHKLNKAKYLR